VTRIRGTPAAALLAATLLACCLPAGLSRAAEALYLTWNECALDGLAVHDRTSVCGVNTGGQDLFVAFRMPFASDSVLGLEIVVDVQHSAATMPDWWMLASDGCRAGALQVSFDFTTNPVCADFFLGNASGGLQGYYVREPRGGTNQARMKLAGAFLPAFGYASLNADDLYYGAKMSLLNVNTVSPGPVCPGCFGGACLVLNSILVRRQPGAAGGDVYLTTPGPANANFATWQGGTGASCAAVPARSVTWGRLKSLYR